MAKKNNQEVFSQMYLAKALEGEVQSWVDQGWPGVTQTTLELFHYWFQRGDDLSDRQACVEERFYDCQRRAIETVVYCYEILKSKSLLELFEVETDKSIYPRIGYQIKSGGFERDFMLKVLNPSAEVLSYAKLDRRHRLKITYRDHTGILRNYEVDLPCRKQESTGKETAEKCLSQNLP